MSVSQDGTQIGAGVIDAEGAAGLEGAEVTWGSGLFGPLAGDLINKTGQ